MRRPIVVFTRREGEHDEWNMVRAINQRRFDAGNKGGLAARLGVMFDSYLAAPGLFDAPIAAGNIQACPRKAITSHSFGLRQSDCGSALMNPTLLCP
jgi:hypothetical protein